MFKSILQSSLVLMFTFLSIQSFSQVQVNSVIENNPPFNDCSNSYLQADGQLMSANYTFIGNSVTVVGFNITVNIEYTVGGIILPAIVPFTQVIDLGVLPAGNYNITTNGILNGTVGSTVSTLSVVTACCGANPAFAVSDATVCTGDLVTLTNNSTGTTSQEWYENNVLVSTSTDHSFTPATPGTYTFKLVVTDGICTDSVEQTVTAYTPPTVTSITPTPSTLCVGEELYLTGTANNAFSYTWFIDFVQVGSGQTTSTTAVGTGTHTVTLIALSACADSMQTTVTYLAPPVINNITPAYSDCLGNAVSLNANSTGATSEIWYENYVQVGTGNSYSTNPSTAGNYTYTYVASDGTCSDSIVTNVMIHNNPVVDLGPDTNSCSGAVTLDAGAGYVNYEWQDMSTNQTLVADSGTYYVTVTDTIGCQGTDTIEVTNCVSIYEINDMGVVVYPNPFTNQLNIDYDQSIGYVHIRLTDALGRLMYEDHIKNNVDIVIDTELMKPGVYYLELRNEKSKSLMKLIRN